MAEIIYLNGHLVPRSEARLSPFDHGFLYGYGLFETMRAYDGHIFRLDRHLSRLRRSADTLGLAYDVTASRSPDSERNEKEREAKQSLEAACMETLRANKLKDARVRLAISAGEGDMTPDPTTCSGPTVLITAKDFVPPPREKYELGFKAVLSSLRRNSHSPLSRLKSTCYLDNILARMEAKAAGCDEAILLNERGYLAEGSITNIFLVSKGELITPSLETGVLAGITREAVLEIAQALDIRTVEREVETRELSEAEEAFATNSLLEIMPLTWLDRMPVGTGKAGQLTKKLMAAYVELVYETPGDISP
jgi:branched-chain amino acid aminotransferase group I